MPFDHCIAAALADGLIDGDRADEFSTAYRDYEAAFRSSMTPHEAAAAAAQSTFAELEQDVAERRRQTFLTLGARADILQRLDTYRHYVTGKHDPYLAATGLYDRLLPGRNGLAVEQQREFWRGQAHAHMDEAFRAYRHDLLGRQGKRADEGNIVDEAFGKDTGDAEAKAIAGGWAKAHELVRAGFNRFGGHIGIADNYGFPTFHAQRLVNEVNFDTWKNFLVPLLDRSKMLTKTGSRPLGSKELENALRDMYDNIVTQGWASAGAATSRNPRATSLANRRADPRFVQFRDGAAWLAYQKRFGEGNVFDTMMHHIDTMSRDIAHMQVLGPNPAATVQWIKNELERRANLTGKRQLRAKATKAAYALDNLYAQYSGHANAPVNHTWAEIEGDVRNVLGSAMLGSASLTAAPTDANFSRMTRAMNGLPHVRAMGAYLKLLNPASPEDRLLAVRLGLTGEGYARTLNDSARMMDQVYGHKWSKWLIDRTLTYSGLTPHTEAARWTHGWISQGLLADEAKTAWKDLDPTLRGQLESYRVGEGEWNEIRKTPLYTDRGATFLRPGDVMARTDIDQQKALELGQRIADWLMTETEFAVPSTSLRGRALARGATRPGTLPGTLLSSPLMFKTFAMTYLLSHGRRMLAQTNWAKRGAYLGSIAVMSTFAGAIALQLREIATGRNPRDMTDPKFWGAATAQGGGLGMAGDLVYASTNEQGRGAGEMAAGPQAGVLGDVGRFVFGAPLSAAEAKNPQKGKSALANNTVNFVKRYSPGANIWWARAVIERYMFDAIQSVVDPNWKKRLHNVERWYRKNTGQSYWWHRGRAAPSSAPDLGAAAGHP